MRVYKNWQNHPKSPLIQYHCENKDKPTTLELLPNLLNSSRFVSKKCDLILVKLIIDNLENKNPWLETGGLNALSQAARLDNMEAYKLISKELDEKKSKR